MAGPENSDDQFMKDFMRSFAEHSDQPGIDVTMIAAPAPAFANRDRIAAEAKELTHAVARELAAGAPAGWEQLDAVFAWSVAMRSSRLYYAQGERLVVADPAPSVLDLVDRQREVAARMPEGPWWRLLIRVTSTGTLETEYDYGDEPIPDQDLLPPDAYLADLEAHPRPKIPVWLGAYIGHGDRQRRSPRDAAAAARKDHAAGIVAQVSIDDLPGLPRLWAYWTTVAAVFAATGATDGPRILPSVAWFEGPSRSGSTLYLLAHDRAVLSGGTWNAPALEAAYNDGASLPAVYAGAPEWITDSVLNPRAGAGTLSFCYWWADGAWYRGQSPSGPEISDAVPGVWSATTTLEVVLRVCAGEGHELGGEARTAAEELIAAAESGRVSRGLLSVVLDPQFFDIDAAFDQFTLAGLTYNESEPRLSEQDAVTRVRNHIRANGFDTDGFPLDELAAAAIDHGWMVYVPTAPGRPMLGRAIYYIAHDSHIEKSSSSIPPEDYIPAFGQRFRERVAVKGRRN